MFKANYTYGTFSEVSDIMRNMVPEVRALFNEVEALVRLLLVVPASSAEAERSFSALRRLKTWLHSSMLQTQQRGCLSCSQSENGKLGQEETVKNLLKFLIGACTFLGHFRISRLRGNYF